MHHQPTSPLASTPACISIMFIAFALGCASPGPPHAPSLYLPKPPNDLTASRIGDHIELRFTVPSRTTDSLPLKPTTMHLRLCRQLGAAACTLVPTTTLDILPAKPGIPTAFASTDTLPPELQQGPARILQYKVELLNQKGQGAGYSEPAFTAAGTAPAMVQDLRAEGSRLGIVLQWKPAEDAVVLEREDLAANAAPSKRKGGVPANLVRLAANAKDRTLDTSIKPDTPYLYKAVRERSVTLGGRTLVVRSTPSAAVPFTLHLSYPPPAPTGLTVAGYTADSGLVVDLIWQPVDDAGQLAPLAGYNIYRVPTDSTKARRAFVRLNAAPIPVPAFHDTTAASGQHYLYRVTAVDTKGNESPAASATYSQP